MELEEGIEVNQQVNTTTLFNSLSEIEVEPLSPLNLPFLSELPLEFQEILEGELDLSGIGNSEDFENSLVQPVYEPISPPVTEGDIFIKCACGKETKIKFRE